MVAIRSEDDLQIQVAKWLDDNLHEDVIFFHVPNETKAKPQYHAKRKRLGVKAGVPDIVIHWTEDANLKELKGLVLECVLYIELKRPTIHKVSEKTGKKIIDQKGGTLSEAQIAFQTKCKNNGMAYYEADNLVKVRNLIDSFRIPLREGAEQWLNTSK